MLCIRMRFPLRILRDPLPVFNYNRYMKGHPSQRRWGLIKCSILSEWISVPGGQKKRSSCTRTGAGRFLPQRLVATMKIPEKISVIMMTIFALRSSRKAELLIPKKSPIRMNGYVMAACFRLAALMIPVAM